MLPFLRDRKSILIEGCFVDTFEHKEDLAVNAYLFEVVHTRQNHSIVKVNEISQNQFVYFCLHQPLNAGKAIFKNYGNGRICLTFI